MKIYVPWLLDYAPNHLEVNEIARILTDCGLEVEAVETFRSIDANLDKVLIGQVMEVQRHPNADRLTCCKVDVGAGGVLDIVCGAPNVAAGQKVAVATVGARVMAKGQEVEIKEGKIRGEPSQGMLCAEDELGLGGSHEGIMVLDASAVAGMPAGQYFGLVSGAVLEVAITPNRGDAASHIGVARDLVAAVNNRETQHKPMQLIKPSVEAFRVDNRSMPIGVSIESPEACRRYSGLTLQGIQVAESPEWLRNSLKAIGLRPINNVVDITNFVLMETGQPLHAFDASYIKSGHVSVKKLPKDTPFVTLDGMERKLGADDLMICDGNTPLCIGGVFGGLHSGVTAATTDIFLESACFESTHIRKTSKAHNLKTDASFRFERGSDPDMTVYALKRAAQLIVEVAGGKVSSDIVDVYPEPVKPLQISLSLPYVDRLIGKKIPAELVKSILKSLEIEILDENNNELRVSVPPFKSDVTRPADLVEEILRIYGYNQIEFSQGVRASLSYSRRPDPESLLQEISNYLSNNGFNEIMTNSLSSQTYYDNSEAFPLQNCVTILNPLSRELGVMRQTLLFTGLESVERNLNHRMSDQMLYEFGNVYFLNREHVNETDVTRKYTYETHLSLFASGNQNPENWQQAERKVDYYFLKSMVFNVFRKCGIPLQMLVQTGCDSRLFSEGETWSIHGKTLAKIGLPSKQAIPAFDLRQPVYFAEINWNVLLAEIGQRAVKYREISRFPEVRRDLALLMPAAAPFVDLEKIAYRVGKGWLKNVNLFDVYEGDKIEAGKKSYAVSFVLQDKEKTLTDSEIEQKMHQLRLAFEKELGAIIR